MRRFWKDTEEMFDYFHPEYTEVRDLGDSVLAIGTLTVRGRGSGAEVQIPMAFLAEFRDDRDRAAEGLRRGGRCPRGRRACLATRSNSGARVPMTST